MDEHAALWPSIDVFSDDTFGTMGNGDTRLCQRPPGAPVGDYVRLVRVSLVRSDGIVCCETCISSLSPPKRYTAISYAWGSPRTQRSIILDGRQHLVTESLWRFLKHAEGLGKHSPGSGWLWIDALSIDQRSPLERTYQVGIMANIFWEAERVLVWLGPAYGNSIEAMQAMSASVMQLQRVPAFSLPWTKLAETAFVGLCERPYWRRLWVFQELRAGREIHLMCGSNIVPCGTAHSDLWRFFSNFVSDDSSGERCPRRGRAAEAVRYSPAWDMIRHVFQSNIDRVQTTLWTLLTSTRNLHCADGRDRVYALLSISTSGHQGICADYTISMQCLLNRILRNWHSYLRPSSLHEVSRQCSLLEDMFSLDRNAMYMLGSPDISDTSFHLDRHREFEWKRKEYGYAKVWAEFYGHTEICRLLQSVIDTKGLPEEKLRGGVLTGQFPNTMTCARPQPGEPRTQVPPREPGRATVFGEACFLVIDRWTNELSLRFKKLKHTWNHKK